MRRETTKDLFVVMGALYSACLFLGVNNASSIQPVISIERTVYYREKATGMYSAFPYAVAQVCFLCFFHLSCVCWQKYLILVYLWNLQGLVELPYIALQAILYGLITYFMINYERTWGMTYIFICVFIFSFYVHYLKETMVLISNTSL